MLVSSDGTIARDWLGKGVPARLVVVGIVDRVTPPPAGRGAGVMRLGIVRGHVVLSRAIPALQGTSLLLVEPVTAANLAARNGQGGGRTLVVADKLSPADGPDDRDRRGQRGGAAVPGPDAGRRVLRADRERLHVSSRPE